jgi:hypothetical protein
VQRTLIGGRLTLISLPRLEKIFSEMRKFLVYDYVELFLCNHGISYTAAY